MDTPFWFLFAALLLSRAAPLSAQTDLAVTQSDAPDPLQAGANLIYTIKAQNLGPNAVGNATLSIPVPPNTTFVSFAAPAGWTSTKPAVGGTGTVSSSIASLSALDGLSSFPYDFTALGSTVLFSAAGGGVDPVDGGGEFGLWKSNGTAAGTVLVKNIPTANLTNVGSTIHSAGTVFFAAWDEENGSELWKSNGTTTGTVMVKNINPDGSSFPSLLTAVKSKLFFMADDGVNGRQLWVSDGTTDGTVLVKVILPVTDLSGTYWGLEHLTAVDNTLFFVVGTETAGTHQLWKSDGTAVGTVPLQEFVSGSSSIYVHPDTLTASNDTLFFFAYDSLHGKELWRSDGTPAGTVLVKDVYPGTVGSIQDYSRLLDVDGTLFFAAYHDTLGLELWKSDGTTTGTVLVKDINQGMAHSTPTNLTNVHGALYFSAEMGTTGRELWKTNGTSAGTFLVKDIYPGATGSSLKEFCAVDSTLYLTARDDTHGEELWKSNGTAAGTVLLKDTVPGEEAGFPEEITNVDGTLFFRVWDYAVGAELWKSSGGIAHGTVRLRNIAAPSEIFTLVVKVNPGTPSGTAITNTATISSPAGDPFPANNSATTISSIINPLADLSVTLTDSPDPVVTGNHLTYTITIANAGPTSAANVLLTSVVPPGTKLFSFTAPAGWVSSAPNFNETGPITSGLATMDPGTAEFAVVVMVNSGLADNTTLNNSASVTSPTSDPVPGNASASTTTLARSPRADMSVTTIATPDPVLANENVTYNITVTNHGPDLARQANFTTSAPANTTYVSGPFGASGLNLGTGDLSSSPNRLTEFNGALLFSADDGPTGRELWKSDGSTAGTARLLNINAGSDDGVLPLAGPFVELNGFLYFSATDATNGNELWKSNGSAAGTAILKNIRGGSASSSPARLTKVGGTIFFAAYHDDNGTELWKTDGSPGNTVLVRDINPGTVGSVFEKPFLAVGNTLFFAANDGTSGTELWKSNGTEAGTVRVRDIRPGAGASNPEHLTTIGGILYFTADDGVNGEELWRSDGSQAGTVPVADIYDGPGDSSPRRLFNYGGTLIFLASDGARGPELWRSDGTADGTALVRDIQPGFWGSYPSGFAELNGLLIFQADDGVSGRELWRTDGTEAGTTLVRDIRPGSDDSDPAGFGSLFDPIIVNGTLFVAANDGVTGSELWRSDGTEAGTTLVRNINPGGSSAPQHLCVFNGTLFFVADNGVNGRELWRSDGTAPGTVLVRNIQAANAITYSLVVKVNAGVAPGTILSHTASVSNFTPDPVTGNNSVTTTTTVVAFNAQPTLSNLEAAPLDYTEGNAPVPVTATVTPADANSFSLASATVAITGNYLAGEDVLGFTGVAGITGSFEPTNGILTLSGAASLARYQAALRAVTYHNTSLYPVTLSRIVRFQINDGAATSNLSNVLIRAIIVTALDDTPQIISIGPEPGTPGTSRFTFSGIAGRIFTIEFTDTLEPSGWQWLGAPQADAQGIFTILDTPPPGTIRRFYRARFP